MWLLGGSNWLDVGEETSIEPREGERRIQSKRGREMKVIVFVRFWFCERDFFLERSASRFWRCWCQGVRQCVRRQVRCQVRCQMRCQSWCSGRVMPWQKYYFLSNFFSDCARARDDTLAKIIQPFSVRTLQTPEGVVCSSSTVLYCQQYLQYSTIKYCTESWGMSKDVYLAWRQWVLAVSDTVFFVTTPDPSQTRGHTFVH